MSRPSWFQFTTAILGLMRKRASPCIQKGLNALQQWSTCGHWNYMLINVRQPFTVGILIMNTTLKYYLLSTELERVDFMKDLGVVFDSELIFFCFSSPSFSSPANSSISITPMKLTALLSQSSCASLIAEIRSTCDNHSSSSIARSTCVALLRRSNTSTYRQVTGS